MTALRSLLSRLPRLPRLAAAGAMLIAASRPAAAASYEIGPGDNLQASVDALLPGDELVLRGGTYLLTARFSIRVSGLPGQPIVIRAKVGEVPVLTRDPSQNTVNIEGVRDLVVQRLEITGGSHGIRLVDASDVTIEDCHVHHVADVGISANFPGSTYRRLRLLRNDVHHTGNNGEGFYLGCNNAACIMADSLIEGNHVHDTVGTLQGDGIEVKDGSYGNVIRGNTIHDTGYPCILVYGTGGQPVNVVEGNLMWACGDHGIQAAADALLRNNIILGAAADGIHSQIHQSAVPGNLRITHNTVLVDGDALRMSDVTGSVVVANNALYSAAGLAIRAAGNTAQVTSAGNAGTGATQGIAGGYAGGGSRALDFVDAAAGDVHLAAGSRLIAAGDPVWVEPADFAGAARNGVADIGAYRFGLSCLAGLTPRRGLLAVKSGGGASFTWDADAAASEYHLNQVTAKTDLAGAGPHLPDLAGGVATSACTAPAPALTCADPGALGGPPRRFYQALSACGPTGRDEGPVD